MYPSLKESSTQYPSLAMIGNAIYHISIRILVIAVSAPVVVLDEILKFFSRMRTNA
jgi:hypothetical protein